MLKDYELTKREVWLKGVLLLCIGSLMAFWAFANGNLSIFQLMERSGYLWVFDGLLLVIGFMVVAYMYNKYPKFKLSKCGVCGCLFEKGGKAFRVQVRKSIIGRFVFSDVLIGFPVCQDCGYVHISGELRKKMGL